ncbi:MAG TPA: cutinase family protein [Mycobacteriales bacterium]|nr:cutinase family protein [Mycobacteriales bacterium]
MSGVRWTLRAVRFAPCAVRFAVPVALAGTLAATGAAAAAAPSSTGSAATAASTCAKVYVIGARGSGEAGGSDGLGAEVSALATTVTSTLATASLTTQTVADSYRADSVNDFIPSAAETAKLESMITSGNESGAISWYYDHNVTPYLASIKAGVTTAVKDARMVSYFCPHSYLMFAGYSQGAMVTHQTEWRLANKFPAVAARIVGTILLADGDRIPNTKAKQFGTATSGGEGVRTWLKENNGKDVLRPATTANICNAGDIVCDFNAHRLYPAPSSEKAGAAVHTSYADDPALAPAATWVADQAIAAISSDG